MTPEFFYPLNASSGYMYCSLADCICDLAAFLPIEPGSAGKLSPFYCSWCSVVRVGWERSVYICGSLRADSNNSSLI